MDLDFVGFQLAAKRIDFNDPRHAPQLERDLPVENRAKVHLAEGKTRLRTDLELINLAHPGRNRSHLRITHSRRNVFPRHLQPFIH